MSKRTPILYWAMAAAFLPSAAGAAPKLRPYAVEDDFRREYIDYAAVSPDGTAIAFARRRAKAGEVVSPFSLPVARDDVWLQLSKDAPPAKLIDGQSDGSGWFAPKWSPDGKTLALLSSRGGDVGLWLYDVPTHAMRRVLGGINFQYGASNAFRADGGCRWSDATHLVCVVMQHGAPSPLLGPGGYFPGVSMDRAVKAWQRAASGQLTSSVIDSDAFALTQSELVLVDARTASVKPVGAFQVSLLGRDSDGYWLAPDGRTVVLLTPDIPARATRAEREADGSPSTIELRTIDGKPIALNAPLPKDVLISSIRWAPGGRSLSFFARAGNALGRELYRVDLDHGTIGVQAIAGLTFAPETTRSGGSIAGTKPKLEPGRPSYYFATADDTLVFKDVYIDASDKRGWAALRVDGRVIQLGSLVSGPVQAVYPTEHSGQVLVIADGDVWRVDLAAAKAENLTKGRIGRAVGILPDFAPGKMLVYAAVGDGTRIPDPERASVVSPGLVLSSQGPWLIAPGRELTRDYAIDIASGAATLLRQPGIDSAVFATGGGTAVYFSENESGTALWRVSADGASQLAAFNSFWRDIARPIRKLVDYTTFDGLKAKALVMLPAGYKPGTRYPVVVDGDIGYTAESVPLAYDVADAGPPGGDGDIFAAHGFVYVFASLPVTAMDRIGRDNLLSWAHGVVPAADKVVALGLGDPDQLFLYGQSSMGFGVNGIITQTSRFKAAASAIGWVDQESLALGLDIGQRYSVAPFDLVDTPARYIDNHSPPWEIADLLRRNSPLTYVDRVQTPLLILDGDFDMGFMENSERFFSALVRQHKPARFVRYWGEAHGNNSPANVVDYWNQIFAWFDQWGAHRPEVKALISAGHAHP